MGKQNEIIEPSNLFNKDGSLVQRGWAKKPILKYNKECIGKGWLRIKEWDHYSILNKKFGIQLTIGDIGYVTQMSYVWLDFENRKRDGKGLFKFFTKSKLLPLSSLEDSSIEFPTKKFKAKIIKSKNKRIISIKDPKFQEKGLNVTIELEDNPKMDNTVVATGYKEDPRLFYYNHKINYMPAEGIMQLGDKSYNFHPETSFGLLDWGRGVWPYRTHWLWASACGKVDGVPVAFNIGYGFGDLSTHTENIVFYDGKAHKIDEVTFHHENRDPIKPWRFSSNDNRFNMVLKSLIPHKAKLNFGIIMSDTSLLHGLYSGDLVLDNGEKIYISGITESSYWGGIHLTLARTDPKKAHKGFSFFALPLKDNENIKTTLFEDMGRMGISTGGFNMENVELPEDHLIGELNRGFYYAMEGFSGEGISGRESLGNERVGI